MLPYRSARQRADMPIPCARWLWARRRDFDLVIDEVNTLPFLPSFVPGANVALLIHQLAREVWWKEAPLPLAALGYVAEPLALQMYRGKPSITISESSAKSLREIGIARRCRIVEAPLPPPIEPLSIGGSGIVGYVGRVTPSKRLDHVVRAFRMVKDRVPTSRLIVVGKGSASYVRSLKRLVSRLSLAECVEFAGFVSEGDRNALMRSFDCLLLASAREGWGLVVSEAAAAGVPAVAYDVPGLRDSIQNGLTGVLVRNGDVAALGEATARLLEDSHLRQRLGAGAAQMLSRFSRAMFDDKVRAMIGDYASGQQ